MPEKPAVVFKKQSDVGNAVLQHGDTFKTEPESKSFVLFRVITDIDKHGGIHHTGTENFQPAALSANTAAAP